MAALAETPSTLTPAYAEASAHAETHSPFVCVILEAKDLRAAVSSALGSKYSDSVATLDTSEKEYSGLKTTISKGNVNPRWDEAFLVIVDNERPVLKVSIFHEYGESEKKEPESLGFAEFNLAGLADANPGRWGQHTETLQGSQGQITIQVRRYIDIAVKVHSAAGLKQVDPGMFAKSDPYFQVQGLVPGLQLDHFFDATSTIQDNLKPIWATPSAIPVRLGPLRAEGLMRHGGRLERLKICGFDEDRGARKPNDDPLGHVALPWKNVWPDSLNCDSQYTLPLVGHGHTSTSVITFSVAPAHAFAARPETAYVVVIRDGKGVCGVNAMGHGLADPVAKLHFSSRYHGHDLETSVQKGAVDPHWDEAFLVILPEAQPEFRVDVFDAAKGAFYDGPHVLLGSAMFNLSQIVASKPAAWNTDIKEITGTEKSKGTICIEVIKYYDCAVKIRGAIGLKNVDAGVTSWHGKSDAYVKIQGIKPCLQTDFVFGESSTIQQNLNPVWEPPDEFPIRLRDEGFLPDGGKLDRLKLCVYDEDKGGRTPRDDPLGHAQLPWRLIWPDLHGDAADTHYDKQLTLPLNGPGKSPQSTICFSFSQAHAR